MAQSFSEKFAGTRSVEREQVALGAASGVFNKPTVNLDLASLSVTDDAAGGAVFANGPNEETPADDRVSGLFTQEELAQTEIPSVEHAIAGLTDDGYVLLAQAGSSDAGGGLVQQEEEGDSGANWLGLLALLGLAAAAGGGGGGDDVTTIKQPDINIAGSAAVRVSWTGGTTSPQTGFDQFATVAWVNGLSVNMDGSISYDPDGAVGSFDKNAANGTFETWRGSLDTSTRTFMLDSGGNDVLVIFDPDYNNVGDYGFVVTDITGTSFTLEGRTVTLVGSGSGLTVA